MATKDLEGLKEDVFIIRVINDINVNEVLNILEECSMYQEKEKLSVLLSKIDEKYQVIQAQEDCVHELKNELKKINDPQTKSFLSKRLNELIEDYNDYKNKFIVQNKLLIETFTLLVEIFENLGSHAFCKNFKEISKSLKLFI